MKKDPASSNTTPRQSRSNVVPLKGEIDLHVSPTVTAALNDVIDKKPEQLVVDLYDVSYIDSASIGCLMDIHRLLQDKAGAVKLSGLQPRVETMISMTGVHKIIDIHRDESEALAAFQTRKGR